MTEATLSGMIQQCWEDIISICRQTWVKENTLNKKRVLDHIILILWAFKIVYIIGIHIYYVDLYRNVGFDFKTAIKNTEQILNRNNQDVLCHKPVQWKCNLSSCKHPIKIFVMWIWES